MELLDNPTTLERMLLDRAKCARTPANGSIELLPLCNMNCDMCYVRLSRREMEACFFCSPEGSRFCIRSLERCTWVCGRWG